MYVCRADCLALDNQLASSALGKATSKSPRLLPSPTVVCTGLRPCGLSPLFHLACPLTSSLFSSCLGGHVNEDLWVYLPMLLEDTVSQQTPWFPGSYNPPPLLPCYLSLRRGSVCSCSHWDQALQLSMFIKPMVPYDLTHSLSGIC